MDEEEKNDLKVADLEKLIRSRHNSEDKYIIEENRELQAENKHLQDIVEMYRDKSERFRRFRNKAIAVIISGILLFQGKNILEKYEEDKIAQEEAKIAAQVTSNEMQLDEEIKNFNLVDILGDDVKAPQNIKLGTALENYVGFDLDDKKVERLDTLSSVSKIKYLLDSGNPNVLTNTSCKVCVSFIYDYIRDIIYSDNPELNNYYINIQDGYLYANGEYIMNSELFYSYSLGEDVSNWFLYGEDFGITIDELDLVIDTCLKATCYDVLLYHEKGKLDYSLARIAKEYDYQLPPANNIKNDRCEVAKVKEKTIING